MTRNREAKEKFLQEHPLCFACGEPSVEWDHLPSKACFDDKGWPEGFVFPVCYSCNHATSNDEQMIAALARADSGPAAPVKTNELEKYLTGGRNNDPALFATLMTGVVGELPDGRELVQMGTGVREVFRRVLPKWARAFHYLETREILALDETIYGNHFTVLDVARGSIPKGLFDICQPRAMKRGARDLGDQIAYARAASPDGKLYAYCIMFRRAIGAWMIINKGGPHRDDPAAQHSLLPPLRKLGA